MFALFFEHFFLETAAIIGLLLGSFYNVCIHRYGRQSIIFPGSHCPNCKHKLTWWENIPLFSYALLQGRCRSCRQHISLRYPFIEALSGLLAFAFAWKFGFGIEWLVYMFFIGILLIASFIDFENYILPDIFTLGGGVLAVAASFILPVGYKNGLIGAAIGAGFFLLLQQSYKFLRGIDGLGTGDIKLMILLGALIGWRGLPIMILLSAFSALIVSLFYLKKNTAKGMQTAIPFGPFLSLGAILQILFGNDIIQFYLDFCM